MGTPITLVIADDHDLFRESLRMLLDGLGDVRVVAEARNAREAVRLTRMHRPDVLLLDLSLPDASGLEVVRELSRHDVRMLLLTAAASDSDILDALQLGARGIILKDASPDMLPRALRAVMAGEYWIGRNDVSRVVDRMRERSNSGAAASRSPTADVTPRQRQILAAIAAGATNRDIARQLSIGPSTVKYHLAQLFDKLGVSTRLELALLVRKHPLPDPPLDE